MELLYLLCNPKEQEDATLALERETARRLAEIRRYMEEHLDEPLTIPFLSRRACLSTTTFKSPCSHLAAPAADGTGGGAAAGLLPQRAGGSPIGRIWQRQPVLRRLSPAVRYDTGQVSKNVRTGITLSDLVIQGVLPLL